VHAAGHEGLAVGENDVLVATAHELHDRAVTRNRLADQFQGLHAGDVTAREKLSKNGLFVVKPLRGERWHGRRVLELVFARRKGYILYRLHKQFWNLFANEILLDVSESIGWSSFAKEHMECFVTC
jgi:hypothetical protein